MNPPNEDCSADTALKGIYMLVLIEIRSSNLVQFLRLVHSVCDHHPNKYLLLSESELKELQHNNNCNLAIDVILKNQQYCKEPEGMWFLLFQDYSHFSVNILL